MHVFGQFEKFAYRSFSKEEYASSFLAGKIRFGSISYYARSEDKARCDISEGEARFLVNAVRNSQTYISNNVYIFCFHRDLVSARKSNFGDFVVKINDPKKLAEYVTEQISKLQIHFFGGIEGVIVEYTKDEEFDNKLGQLELARLVYSQKPRLPFAIENEYRFILITEMNLGEFFEIDLNRKLEFGELVVNI